MKGKNASHQPEIVSAKTKKGDHMYYSAMLNIKGKKTVVVGGGKVAERKIKALLDACADITVVSPDLSDHLLRMHQEKKISWKQKTFEKDDVNGAFLVIAATNEREVNEQVYQSCEAHQLINVVDAPEKSNIIMPATFKRGDLIISVSTSGKVPGLARKLKNNLAEQFDEHFADYVEFLKEGRKRVLEEINDPEQKRMVLHQLLDKSFLEASNEERHKQLEMLLNANRSSE
ncbi:MAG: NAD(P)-binding protein [Bacillaceae bacterium]|nr:MAG: NAD(P)-binding protein [Bacillaceae bacterium]